MQQIFHIIRKITVPPVFAVAFLFTFYAVYPLYFGSLWQLLFGILFLGILPILGYPLQKFIPPFREKGREGQRTLAMIFSMIGYLLGTIVSLIGKSSAELHTVYFLYLSCGICILIFNKLLHLKASGHACGITGPILLFFYFQMVVPAIIGMLFAIPVMVSSVKTKRHTALQLVGGCAIAVVCMLGIHCLMQLLHIRLP